MVPTEQVAGLIKQEWYKQDTPSGIVSLHKYLCRSYLGISRPQVKAFVASYNKKVAEEDAVSVAGLQKVEPTQLHQQHAAISHALPARRWRSMASSCSKR